MAYFSVSIGCIPPAVIHAPLTSHLFIPRYHTIKIWEASIPHIIFETKAPNTSKVKSICPSRDGNRISVGSKGGIVRMWDMNLARN